MSTVFYLAGYLSQFSDGRSTVTLDSRHETVGSALAELWQQHAGLRDRVLTETGVIRPHVNIFVGNRSVKQEAGLETTVCDGEEISILPAVSGG